MRCSPVAVPQRAAGVDAAPRHMTGDVFRGYLLDGFFNLVGALTGQGILLVGMMTEAVVTPWLCDRDLALQNVRYVLDAAGALHEDFRPAPTASSPSGPARCWGSRSTCSSGSPTTTRGCSTPSPTAPSG